MPVKDFFSIRYGAATAYADVRMLTHGGSECNFGRGKTPTELMVLGFWGLGFGRFLFGRILIADDY